MQTSLDIRDLWSSQHRDCTMVPMDLDMEIAEFVRTTHAGHGPECCQYLAASAYYFEHAEVG